MRNSSLSKHGCGIQILINSGFKETPSASTSKRQDAISDNQRSCLFHIIPSGSRDNSSLTKRGGLLAEPCRAGN